MNTINHYVGMFPIATGAPVEKPLAKFFFGFFAVMMLAFMMAKKKPRLMVLTAGFAAVTAWMIGDQFVMGHLESHVQDYMKESGTFFKDMERINVWGDNVRNVSKIVIFGLIGVMGIVIAGLPKFAYSSCCWHWFRRCCRSSLSSPTPAGCGSLATTCIRGAPLPSSLSCPPSSAKARSRSSRPSPILTGVMAAVIIFVCMMLALLIRRKQLREGQAE
jgi:hypothetical protein